MPGVSGRGDVPGMYGIGKVKLRFKKRERKPLEPVGFSLFVFCLCFSLFSILWAQPYIRFKFLLPCLQLSGQTLRGLFGLQKHTILNNGASTITSAVDEWHVTGNTLENALSGQGYLHASEKMFQMDLLRRLALGRLSEMLGSDTLEADRFFLTINMEESAKTDFLALSEQETRFVNAYTRGVNMYLESLHVLPLEYYLIYTFRLLWSAPQPVIEPWQAYHTLLIMRMQAYELSVGWESELLQKYLENNIGEADLLAAMIPASQSVASNASSASSSSLHQENVNVAESISGMGWILKTSGELSSALACALYTNVSE
jgi:hypothetical protein